MVASMINRDPTKRLTADEYLDQQTGKAFPTCFYTFLLPYVQRILREFSPDFVIYKYEKYLNINENLFRFVDFIEIFHL
jgi:hypothetical protein